MMEGTLLWRWEGPPVVEVLEVEVKTAPRPRTQVVVQAQGGIPGVVVIAERGGTVAFVRQQRPAVGHALWELPRGFGEVADAEGGEDLPSASVVAAARELAEETGLRLHDAELLGSFFPDSGLLGNRVSVVQGHASRGGGSGLDGETDGFTWVEVSRLPYLIANGTVCDGISLAALCMWRGMRGCG